MPQTRASYFVHENECDIHNTVHNMSGMYMRHTSRPYGEVPSVFSRPVKS